MPIHIYNAKQQRITLEDNPFANGGEGNIHRIIAPTTYQNCCVKLYFDQYRTPKKEQKTLFQVSNPPPNLANANNFIVCWPTEVVYQNQQFAGFVMPLAYANSQQLYALCLPNINPNASATLRQKYDRSTQQGMVNRFKLCVNIASAIHLIHDTQQYVLVDLKPQNILFTHDGKIAVTDIDSVQISQTPRNVLHHAAVATPEYTPTEGHTGILNPAQHYIPQSWDDFSLAVLFYELLMGLHPYTATFGGAYSNQNTIAEKIQNGLFVHGSKASYATAIPRPHQYYTQLPAALQSLFYAAFETGHSYPQQRPTAHQWGDTLYNTLQNTQHIQQHTQTVPPPPTPTPVPTAVPPNAFVQQQNPTTAVSNYDLVDIIKALVAISITFCFVFQCLNKGIDVYSIIFAPIFVAFPLYSMYSKKMIKVAMGLILFFLVLSGFIYIYDKTLNARGVANYLTYFCVNLYELYYPKNVRVALMQPNRITLLNARTINFGLGTIHTRPITLPRPQINFTRYTIIAFLVLLAWLLKDPVSNYFAERARVQAEQEVKAAKEVNPNTPTSTNNNSNSTSGAVGNAAVGNAAVGNSVQGGANEVDISNLPKTTIAFDEIRYYDYDFGTIKEGQVASHTFKFTNTGRSPLVIGSAKGSCGCVASDFTKEPVAPGAKGEIKVNFDTKGKSGEQTKTITIVANTQPSPITLTIKALVLAENEQKKVIPQTTTTTQIDKTKEASSMSQEKGSFFDKLKEVIKKDDYTNKNEILTIADEMPVFPGGDNAMLEFLKNNIQYPSMARENGIEGRVFISFVVNEDGTLSDIEPKREVPGGCTEEAIRVLSSMPKWSPGKKDGKRVRVRLTLPVSFKLTK